MRFGERLRLAWLVLIDSDKIKVAKTKKKRDMEKRAELEKRLLSDYPSLPEPPKMSIEESERLLRAKKRKDKPFDWVSNLPKPKEPAKITGAGAKESFLLGSCSMCSRTIRITEDEKDKKDLLCRRCK